MTRWSLSNEDAPISHAEFVQLAASFRRAAEEGFGAPCALSIKTLKSPKAFTVYDNPEIQKVLDQHNSDNTLFETDDLSRLTEEKWNEARHLELVIRPAATEQPRLPGAFAHAEFKGDRPHQATFYIQPGGEAVRRALIGAAKGRETGDGQDGNGTYGMEYPPSIKAPETGPGWRFGF